MKKIKKLLIGIIGTIAIWVFYYAVWIGFFKYVYIRGITELDFSRILPSWVHYFTCLIATVMTIWVGAILIPEYIFESLEKKDLKKELIKSIKNNKKEKDFEKFYSSGDK